MEKYGWSKSRIAIDNNIKVKMQRLLIALFLSQYRVDKVYHCTCIPGR